jgi:long-chain acyl-CoA synthetase
MSESDNKVRVFPYEQAVLNELNPEGHVSLVGMFEEACAQFPDRPAFTAIGQTLTFADIDRMSRDFAAYLLGPACLEPGQRVAVQLPNLCHYPIAAWGILRAGLVLVNTNPLYTQRELLHQFTDAGVSALVCLADLLPTLEQVVPETGIERVVVTNIFDLMEAQPAPESSLPGLATLPDALALGADLPLPDAGTRINDIAMLQYTGGTTGVAKGAILTHGNVLASSRQSGSIVELDPQQPDIVIAPMPLYHIYGFTMNLCADSRPARHRQHDRGHEGLPLYRPGWRKHPVRGPDAASGVRQCGFQPRQGCDRRRRGPGGGDRQRVEASHRQ